MRIHALFLIVSLLLVYTAAGQVVTNVKGTRLSVDTSKWRLSGADMYNKNTGNVGIGLSLPLYKLDVSATANPLRLSGLQAGAATDSVLTVQNGVVRFAAIGRLITDTSLYDYDGTLTGNRTVTFGSNSLSLATGGSAFNITGLTGGTLTDSLVTISTATGRINRITPSLLLRQDSTTASNGLSLSTKDVRLGGSLTQATTITSNTNALTFATGGTALNITGLTSGAVTDSLLTINAATGRINRIAPDQLLRLDSTTASNGITLSGLDVQLGGALTKKDTITTSATNTLALRGVQTGTFTDSLMTLESGTGIVRKMSYQPVLSVKTTTTQATNVVTFTTINALSFTTVAGATYRVKLWLVYNAAATTTGLALGPNTFTGGNYWYSTTVCTGATTAVNVTGYNTALTLLGTASRGTTNNLATIEMTVEATSAATVSFQFASEVAGSAITIMPNSRLEYQVIN